MQRGWFFEHGHDGGFLVASYRRDDASTQARASTNATADGLTDT
jgi:hypothetical protein